MTHARDLWLALATSLAMTGCVGTTGSDLVTFDAAAAGPADAVKGQDYTFTSGRGYHVVLSCAAIHVGAVYLSSALPTAGAQDTDCILPGFYVAQVTEGLDVDVLDPAPQPFPIQGEGTADTAKIGEVWLTHPNVDVNAPDDPGIVLDIVGEADLGGVSYPFQAQLTIGENRAVPVTDPSMPSAHPICKQRIVTSITDDRPGSSGGLGITPRDVGDLLLRVEPRNWFANVDFSQLDQASSQSSTACPRSPSTPSFYTFADGAADPASNNLYNGFRANQGVYYFTWSNSPDP